MYKLTSTSLIVITLFLVVIGFYKLNDWANKEADTMITDSRKELEEKRDECATFGADIDSENCQVDEANPIEPQSGKD